MELNIPNPQSHRIRLIAVASERLTEEANKYKVLTDNDNNKYEILGFFKLPKYGPPPGGLLLLSTGKEIDETIIWKQYPNSEDLYFFIVNPLK